MILLIGLLLGSTAVFAMMVASFSWQNLLLGFAIASSLTWMFRRQVVPKPLPPNDLAAHLVIYSPKLAWYLFVDILKGTWIMILTTLGIRPLNKPGIVRIPLHTHSHYGVGPVGYFITLSPGSFMVDIDWDEGVMLVHVIDASDPDQVRMDAEKYYRLWEYGRHVPLPWMTPEDKERQPDA
jgi:multicomponent Na+:H+ antiporter subunit E